MSKREVVQRVFRLLGGLLSETAALYREATKSASEIANQQAAEAARKEAARQEAARQAAEAARKEAARQEAAQQAAEAARKEAARQEAAQQAAEAARKDAARQEAAQQAAEAARKEAARQEAAQQAAEAARTESENKPISPPVNPNDAWMNIDLRSRFVADLRDHLQQWEIHDMLTATSADELITKSSDILDQLVSEETENAILAHEALIASLQRLGISVRPTPSSSFSQNPIEAFVRARKIKSLVHFTRVDKLQYILREGLLNHRRLRELQRSVLDQYRYDGKTDHVCVSVEFPNYQMFYRYAQDDAADWCVLTISPSILWRQECLFYPYNAASSELARRPASDFRGLRPLLDLFAEVVQSKGRHPRIPDSFPTSPQAEVLVPSVISVSDISGAHFCSSRAMDSCRQLVDSRQIRFLMSRELFKPRLDWEQWRRA
jgi:chemotaxis protein histidine kinase CheA